MKNYKSYRYLLLLGLVLISIALIKTKKDKISTDISILLPADSWIDAHLRFMRESRLGSVIALSVGARGMNAEKKFPIIAGELEKELSSLDHVEQVFAVINTGNTIESATELFHNIAQILTFDDLNEYKLEFSSSNIRKILKNHYKEMIRPGGLFRQKLIARDPMNFFSVIIERLQNFSTDSGFFFKIKNSNLISRDNKHLLVLIYSNLNVTDPDTSELFFKKLKSKLKKIVPDNEYDSIVVSAHRHAIENKNLLKHDIMITMLVAGLGFLLLFIVCFKDWRSIYIFLIPIVSMLISIALTILLFPTPSAIILGLGTTVIGIALDYGIHVYAASKYSGNMRMLALKNITRPLMFSALTTLGVFWAFFVSNTPGYKQLAFASTSGIAISLLISLYILPSLLPEGKSNFSLHNNFKVSKYKNINLSYKALAIWCAFIVISISLIYVVKIEPDIRKLDGINTSLLKDEESFKKIWGKNTMAAATTKSKNLTDAMYKIDMLTRLALKEKIQNIQSLSTVWPSLIMRKQNAKKWDVFWKSGNANELQRFLISEGNKFSFSKNAFNPFFNNLYKHSFTDDKQFIFGAFKTIAGRFINLKDNQYHVTLFFPDSRKYVLKMKKFAKKIGGIDIISPGTFGTYISATIINDAMRIGFIAIALTLILALICLKNFTHLCAAFLPVISGLSAIFPVFWITNTPVNAVSCVAAIIVTGLAIDYGIFSVSACERQDNNFSKDAFLALTLSLITTFIGSSALLFACHPALFSVGLVVSAGVLTAYLTAIFITPAVLTISHQRPKS